MSYLIIGALIVLGVLWALLSPEKKMTPAVERDLKSSRVKKKNNGLFAYPLEKAGLKASPKKLAELQSLNDWLTGLVEEQGFVPRSNWHASVPDEAKLIIRNANSEVRVTAHIDVAGQNYDRVGRISIETYWLKDAEDEANYIEDEKETSLQKAKDLVAKALNDVGIS